jgi:hypothetical protein
MNTELRTLVQPCRDGLRTEMHRDDAAESGGTARATEEGIAHP